MKILRLKTIGVVFAACILSSQLWGQTAQVLFDSPGNHLFTVPSGVTEILVECWGGGGGGGARTTNGRGNGGGGGAYSRSVFIVNPAQTFSLSVGEGGPGVGTQVANSGQPSIFGNNLVLAVGGQGVANNINAQNNGGFGGNAASCIGQVSFSGGNGANPATANPCGGGGAAGPTGAGGNASPGIGNFGVGNAPGGDGGEGASTQNSSGHPGLGFGGGGGGAFRFSTGNHNGGAGAPGAVRISFLGPVQIFTQPVNVLFCPDLSDTVQFFAGAIGSNLSYQWQENQGSGWNDLTESATYINVNSSTLSISQPTAAFVSYQYRCVVSGSEGSPQTSDPALLIWDNYCQPLANHFRSKQSGNWNLAANWEVGNGTAWIDASVSPTAANSSSIRVMPNHVMTINAIVSVDQVVVEKLGRITTGTSTMTIANGAGVDMIVKGTLRQTSLTSSFITLSSGAELFIDNGGLYQQTRTYAIPLANWHVNSTCEIYGITNQTTSITNINQNFGNFLWNCPDQTGNYFFEANAPNNVQGNFIVANTGSGILGLSNTLNNRTMTVANFLMQDGTFYVSAASAGLTQTLNVTGNFTQTGGQFEVKRNASIGTHAMSVGGDFSISGGKTIVLNSGTFNAGIGRVTISGNLNISGGELEMHNATSGTNNALLQVGKNLNVSGGALLYTRGTTLVNFLESSSGVYFNGTAEQTFSWSNGILETGPGGIGRRFYVAQSGPTGLHELYSGSTAQATISGIDGEPQAGFVSWPTSGSLLKTLTINNPEDVTMNTDKTVAEQVTFLNGLLHAGACNSSLSNVKLNILNDCAVVGANENAYVNGIVTKTGNSSFQFPIGNGSVYAPVAISAPSLVTDQFGACYVSGNPQTAIGAIIDNSLDHISACEYWFINRMAGSSTVSVDLTWDSRSCGVTSMPDLRVARWNGSTWVNEGNSSVSGNNNAGAISSNPIASFSPFTLSSTTTANPLPVTLTNFSTRCQDDKIQISWTTASELNASHYILQSSRDGQTWLHLAEIEAAGTTNQTSNYSYNDQNFGGLTYYRLVQVDNDGKQEIFGPISSNCSINHNLMTVHPNPSSDNFTVIIQTSENMENAAVDLVDMSGRVILSQTKNINAGSTMLNFDVKAIQPGAYMIRVKGENDKFTPIRVVKM